MTWKARKTRKPRIRPLYLASWRERGDWAPGRRNVYTLDAKPDPCEHGDGQIKILIPTSDELRATPKAFRKAYKHRLAMYHLNTGGLEPGRLLAHTFDPREGQAQLIARVAPGDTLATAERAANQARNHRIWAARALAWAGWLVVVDGITFEPSTH